ncbi:MAG: hypothetical protein V1789_10140 [PVC group bacterium]
MSAFFHNKWLDNIPEQDREVIKKLIVRLFPKLEAIFGTSHYGFSWESTWRKQLRICSPDIFPIFFRLGVPRGQISNIEMQSVLSLSEDSNAFGDKLLELSKQHRPDGSTRVSTTLERMEDYTEKEISKEHIPNILQALFNVGDRLIVPEDEGRGFFSWGNDMRMGRLTFRLLKRYETKEDRYINPTVVGFTSRVAVIASVSRSREQSVAGSNLLLCIELRLRSLSRAIAKDLAPRNDMSIQLWTD